MDEDEKRNKQKTFEDILHLIGEYGPFQWILTAMFFPIVMSGSLHLMLVSFSTLPPQWKCAPNSTICIKNGTFSGVDKERCGYSRLDWEYVSRKDSMISTFDLDCEREWLVHFLTSILFLAWGTGSLFFGWISDNYGRKKVLFVCTSFIIIVGFASSFCHSLPLYFACRFVIGFSYAGCILQPFILISEVVGNRCRPFAGMMIWLGAPVGWGVVALESYLLNDWRMLHICCTLPYILVLVFYKFIPESIEWQYVHGKIDEAKITMKRIAYWNKKEISLSELIFIVPEKIEKRPNPCDLFRTKRISRLTIAQGSMWFCISIGYYGSLLSVSGLGGSVYMNFILMNFGSIFAYFIAPYFCSRFGRKKSCLSFQFIAGILCICNGLIPFKLVTLRLIIGIIGLNFFTMGFNSCYTWGSEIYPTRIRTEGLGFMEICSRAGSSLSPWVGNYLSCFGAWVPYAAMGSFLLLSTTCNLFLHETKDKAKILTQRRKSTGKVNKMENAIYSNDGYA